DNDDTAKVATHLAAVLNADTAVNNAFTVTPSGTTVSIARQDHPVFRLPLPVSGPADRPSFTGDSTPRNPPFNVLNIQKTYGVNEVPAFSVSIVYKVNRADLTSTSGGTVGGTASTTPWQVAIVTVPYIDTSNIANIVPSGAAWTATVGGNLTY